LFAGIQEALADRDSPDHRPTDDQEPDRRRKRAGEKAMNAAEYNQVIAEERWRAEARCADTSSALVELFFSEQLDDILRAKAFCQGCPVREACLDAAIGRREPWGVWGGELFANGKVLAQKRRRGRPPKVAPPEPVIEELVPMYVEKSA
jgi:WhiB family redox-sensing transcriptional regulator